MDGGLREESVITDSFQVLLTKLSDISFSWLTAILDSQYVLLAKINDWFYAHRGEQKGPVSEAELVQLVAKGEFNPAQDLVWREGMSEWKKVGEVPELNLTSAPSSPQASEASVPAARTLASPDPYQAPAANPYALSPLGVTECIARAFALTKRHFGILLAVWAIYFAISIGVGMVFGFLEVLAGGGGEPYSPSSSTSPTGMRDFLENLNPIWVTIQIASNLFTQALSVFLTLGVTRFGLNFISGRPAEIGMMFGEGSKFLRSFGASILYGLMVTVGLLFLIVPGIYLAMRFGQYQNAIVDRNMGVFEAFRYSSSITQNNKMSLFGLSILLVLINLAGMIALCVGLLFTVPLTWLAALVAYRWLQHGPAALEDRGLLRNQ